MIAIFIVAVVITMAAQDAWEHYKEDKKNEKGRY